MPAPCLGDGTMSPHPADFIAREARFGATNYEPLGVVLSRGEGVWVWDTQGKRYLDCLSAYSAVNQGHCHPKIMAAMVEQARKLTLTSRAFHNDQLALFYEEIAALTGSHKVLPMNSGAEAVESAIKSVRKWGYEVKGVPDRQAEIIVCADNFHGRTLGIIGFSTDPAARDHFGPFAAGFKIIAFGDATALKKASRPTRSPFWSNRSREKRASSSHRQITYSSARTLHCARRDADSGREPDRARPHRQAARGTARGHR